MFYRVLIALLLSAGALSGCSLYDSLFHPYRLGTPRMSPEAKAKARAAEKARHKGLSLQPSDSEAKEELADTGSSADSSPPPDAAPPAEADKTKSYSDLSSGIRNTYDKKMLLKRSMLQRFQNNRRQLHHYDLRAPKHTDATREARRLRKHPKGKKDKDSRRKAEAEPQDPVETAPAPDSAPPASEPAKQKPAKNAKQPKAPKPDPTQPAGSQ